MFALLDLNDPTGLAWRVGVAYLLGAVPFGLLMCRLIKGVDLREEGSGNIGATNAMRVLGKPLGILAFLFDVGKGYAPVALLAGSDPLWQVACGTGAVCGHVWPLYLRFKGGKAVATGYGVMLAIQPMIPLYAGLAWLLSLLVFGYVSLSSLVMGLAFPAAAWGLHEPGVVIAGTGGLTLLIWVRHRSNILRLLAGTEARTQLWNKLRKSAVESTDTDAVKHD
ncbi:MAG: glycerol-3-phosphate acyltransferase PlsY [Candidatus Paceibacteria bacterium]|jgi:glycerol-3-phosphate acyltransferase PlsY